MRVRPANLGRQRIQRATRRIHMPMAKPVPGESLLSPKDHTLILIDFQSQMAFATKSIDAVLLRNNAALVANAARIFDVPTIPTTVAERTFSGPMFDEIKVAFPSATFFDRTSMNTWEDKAVITEINRIGNERIVLAGLWTSVCIVGPALSALDQGFEVYVIADACGDVSTEAHERAMERMIQAGARPVTSLQYLLELQRDWARSATYDATTGLAKTFGGAYGIGIIYAKTMLGAYAGEGALAA
jgi:nicotinamidase-related amidase